MIAHREYQLLTGITVPRLTIDNFEGFNWLPTVLLGGKLACMEPRLSTSSSLMMQTIIMQYGTQEMRNKINV